MNYTHEHLEIQKTLKRFIDAEINPHVDEWEDAEIFPAHEIFKKMGNLGLLGLTKPEAYGGLGLTLREHLVVNKEVGALAMPESVSSIGKELAGPIIQTVGTEEHKQLFLPHILSMRDYWCQGFSEPDAGSDLARLRTKAVPEGDTWRINGQKIWTSGAAKAHYCLLLTRTGTVADKHRGLLMFAVPMDTPGLSLVRNIPIMQHQAPEGHCEILLREVRVPAGNLLGQEGDGFAMAQARLGPGRIHHCMRTIGQCELALALMCERTLERHAFGKYLADFANVQEWIAESRLEIDQARLLVLRAAWRLDQGEMEQERRQGRVDVSAIKVVAARLQTRGVNRAMQVFGAMGLSPDTPLAYFWTWGRAMHLLDGPDEVHLRTVARHELDQARQCRGATSAYFTLPDQLRAEPRIR